MSGFLSHKKIVILVISLVVIVLVGCGAGKSQVIDLEAGREVCKENETLHSSESVVQVYSFKWEKGGIERATEGSNYEAELIDAPLGLMYRFKPHFKVTRVDRGYIIETKYDATYDYCIAANNSAKPGTYEITAEVRFYKSLDEEPIAILHIPYQLTIEQTEQ